MRFVQKARAAADRSQPPCGRFWRFPNVSEERKRVAACIMRGWACKAELRRKRQESFLLSTLQPLLCRTAEFSVTPHTMGFAVLESVNKILGSKGRPVPCSFSMLFVCRACRTWGCSLQSTKHIFFPFPVLVNGQKGHKQQQNSSLHSFCALFAAFPPTLIAEKASLCLRSWSCLWSNFSLPFISKYRDVLWSFLTLMKVPLCYYKPVLLTL